MEISMLSRAAGRIDGERLRRCHLRTLCRSTTFVRCPIAQMDRIRLEVWCSAQTGICMETRFQEVTAVPVGAAAKEVSFGSIQAEDSLKCMIFAFRQTA